MFGLCIGAQTCRAPVSGRLCLRLPARCRTLLCFCVYKVCLTATELATQTCSLQLACWVRQQLAAPVRCAVTPLALSLSTRRRSALALLAAVAVLSCLGGTSAALTPAQVQQKLTVHDRDIAGLKTTTKNLGDRVTAQGSRTTELNGRVNVLNNTIISINQKIKPLKDIEPSLLLVSAAWSRRSPPFLVPAASPFAQTKQMYADEHGTHVTSSQSSGAGRQRT